MNTFLVANPKSGSSEISISEIEAQIAQALGYPVSNRYISSGENDEAQISTILAEHQPEQIVIAGGDGTVRMVCNALNYRPLLAILPFGSANGLARCLGIRNLSEALEALQAQAWQHVDGLLLNGNLSLHLSDFGFNAELIHEFEQGNSRGMLGYFKGLFGAINKNTKYRFKIENGREIASISANMLVIANGTHYGTGAAINPKGHMGDGRFELVEVQLDTMGLWHLLKRWLSLENPIDLHARCKSFTSCTIHNLDGAKFQIDGEQIDPPKKLQIEVLKEPFKFISGSIDNLAQ